MWPWRVKMPTQNLLRLYCCWRWCRGSCWQQFVTDLGADVWSWSLTFVQTLSTRVGQDSEVEVQYELNPRVRCAFGNVFITFCTCAVLNESLRNLSLGQQRWLASVIYYLVTPTIKHFPEEKSSYWFSLLERIQTFHNEFKQGIGGRDIFPPLHTLGADFVDGVTVSSRVGELH